MLGRHVWTYAPLAAGSTPGIRFVAAESKPISEPVLSIDGFEESSFPPQSRPAAGGFGQAEPGRAVDTSSLGNRERPAAARCASCTRSRATTWQTSLRLV